MMIIFKSLPLMCLLSTWLHADRLDNCVNIVQCGDKNIIFSNLTQFKANTLDLVWAKGDVCFTHQQF